MKDKLTEMEGGLLLDIVIGEGTTPLKPLAGEDKALLVRGDTLLVLDLSLHIVDGVRRLDLEGDRFSRQGLDDDPHPTAETENRVKGGLLLNVIIIQSSSIFQLLASEDESLLIRRDSLLILDLGLHVVDGVRRLDLQGDRLTREGLDEDLHAEK